MVSQQKGKEDDGSTAVFFRCAAARPSLLSVSRCKVTLTPGSADSEKMVYVAPYFCSR